MILDLFQLTGKVAIVTAAGRGIGAGIAKAFAEVGAKVVIGARTESQLEEVAAGIREGGGEASVVPGDLNSREGMQSLVDRALDDYRRVDGTIPPGEFKATILLTEQLRGFLRDSSLGGMGFFLPIPMDQDDGALLEALGLAQFQGATLNIDLSADGGAIESDLALVASELTGLFGLLELEAGGFSPPAFISEDATNVGVMTVKFSEFFDVIDDAVNTFPIEEREQIQAAVMQGKGIAQPILDTLGPKVWVTSSYDSVIRSMNEPGAAFGGQLIAVECNNFVPLTNTLNMFGPQIGLEPRDFNGNQIFSSPQGGPVIGIGAGHVLVGSTQDVEDALRLAAAGGGGIAESESFTRITNGAPRDGSVYVFQNFQGWTKVAEANEEFGMGGLDPTSPLGPEINKLVEKYIQGMSAFMKATDRGFIQRTRLVPIPANAG